MTTETTEVESSNATLAGEQETVEGLKAKLEAANAEAAKFRKQKADLAKERDELKSKVKTPDQTEDYKSLWTEANSKAQKLIDRTKNADISTALSSQLQKVGIRADAVDAAISLVDRGIINWDEDEGVDKTSVEAAVQVLKGKHKFLFEKVVAGSDGKVAADGNSSGKTMKRSEFDSLSAVDKASRMKDGYKLAD